jgi:ribonuclease-3
MSLWDKLNRLLRRTSAKSEAHNLDQLEGILGYRFRRHALLQQSLTHRSIVRARDGLIPSNERLEFLGDSVLGLVIADQLCHDHPEWPEGDLTKLKAMLVNEAALSRVGMEIGLNKYVLLSSDEERSGGRERPSIVSDACEAVIGAIYLDGGFDAARRVVLACLYSRRDAIVNDDSQRNFKGELLELVQGQGEGSPQYEVINESGPDHDKVFCVAVWVGEQRLGEGSGPSKKEAEQRAAGVALDRLHRPH